MEFELTDRPIAEGPHVFAPAHAGGIVVFEGRVRGLNEGRSVVALEYSSYRELALKEGGRIMEEARARFPLLAVQAVHRLGRVEVGALAVRVEVACAHRGDAFGACRWIIDQIKERVPIWKQELYAEGDRGWLGPDSGPIP